MLNNESKTTVANIRTEEQTNTEISNEVDEKSKKCDKNTGQLYNKGSTISWHQILSLNRVNFFVSSIRISLSSLSVSLSI